MEYAPRRDEAGQKAMPNKLRKALADDYPFPHPPMSGTWPSFRAEADIPSAYESLTRASRSFAERKHLYINHFTRSSSERRCRLKLSRSHRRLATDHSSALICVSQRTAPKSTT
ncbi:uncharacterized protein UHOD_12207 [Ustilago sp. UG-2017b]|nr:uncharacterized protein UHOD_12207 [Ustilago sp. UG-2017b]